MNDLKQVDRVRSNESIKEYHGKHSIIKTMCIAISSSWNPNPIKRPIIDAEFTDLPPLTRAAEAIHYNTLKLEYSLSPNGYLRAWFKLNLYIALVIGIPAILVFPLISNILSQFASWTEYLLHAVKNVFFTILYVIAIGATLIVVSNLRKKRR